MKRRSVMRFIGPKDASKIAGVLFAMRSGRVSNEIISDLRPDAPFAKDVVKALTREHGKAMAKSAKLSPAAREVARDLRPLATAKR
jgi:hypothetical protein